MNPRPMPIMLVCREKTGCRQYPFYTLEEFKKWATRKPYCDETLRVYMIGPERKWNPPTILKPRAAEFPHRPLMTHPEAKELAAFLAERHGKPGPP